MRTLSMLAVALAAVAASSAATAVTCYTLLDGKDNLLYENSIPPVDMSDQGAVAREALRRRNQYLVISEVESCPPVAAAAGTSGYRAATVDEIVGEMRSYLTYGGVSSTPGRTDSVGTGGGGAGATSGAAAARSGSSATRSY